MVDWNRYNSTMTGVSWDGGYKILSYTDYVGLVHNLNV